MKNRMRGRLILRQLKLATLVYCVLVFTGFTRTVLADDDAIDDVETGVDAAISESVAAQSEAVDAKKREAEAQTNLARAKEEASNTIAKAKSKEISAKGEIGENEKKINEAKKEHEKYVRQKADAEKKIIVADQRVAAKKLELTKVRAERNAGRDEKDARLMVLSQKVNELREIEKQIAADKNETQDLVHEISQLKVKQLQMEQNIRKMREKALKVAAYKEKLRNRRDKLKRSISSLPQKLTFKMAKTDCDLFLEAKDKAASVGQISKGKKYEILQNIDNHWLKLKAERKLGFARSSCF